MPNDTLSTLLRLPSRNIPNEYRYVGGSLIPSQADLDTPFEQERRAEWKRVKDREDARIAGIQDLNEQLTAFNRPDVTAMRGEQQGMALQRLLAPVQMKGQYDLQGRQISAEGQIGAAREAGLARRSASEAVTRRVAAGQTARDQAALRKQKNAGLMQRAMAADKAGGTWMEWLRGQPNAEAEALRSQLDFGGAEAGDEDADTVAVSLFNSNPDASPEELDAMIRSQYDSSVLTDDDIAAVIESYNALAGR